MLGRPPGVARATPAPPRGGGGPADGTDPASIAAVGRRRRAGGLTTRAPLRSPLWAGGGGPADDSGPAVARPRVLRRCAGRAGAAPLRGTRCGADPRNNQIINGAACAGAASHSWGVPRPRAGAAHRDSSRPTGRPTFAMSSAAAARQSPTAVLPRCRVDGQSLLYPLASAWRRRWGCCGADAPRPMVQTSASS